MLGVPYPGRRAGKARRQIVAFGGLNWGEGWKEGELSGCEGLSSERFPCLSQRAGRHTVEKYHAATALYAAGKLCVVEGDQFLYDGILEGTVAAGEKQFATINTKVVIFPDKLCFDTATGALSTLEAAYTVTAGRGIFTTGALTVEGGDFTGVFRAGDAVELGGCISHPRNNGRHIVRAVSGDTLTFDPDIFEVGSEGGSLTLKREVPDLECVCECGNRLWGAAGQTIYASALGDPTNFFVYDGLSTDSYAAAVGTGGAFTGCTAFGGTVLFFKEDCIHKVLGNFPAQYEIYTSHVPGVQVGSGKSLCAVDETLFYKGRDGVYAYDGGTPELISGCFGQRRFFDAAAGRDGRRYYISMRDGDGAWGLYVFDTARGIWLREDGTHATAFAGMDGKLYYLDADAGTLVLTGQERDDGGRVPWSATFCPFYEGTLGRKICLRLYLRVELERGAWLRVETSEDGAPFRQVFATHDAGAGTMVIPLLPGRCDKYQIRLSGKGRCLVRSLEREFYVGSEI